MDGTGADAANEAESVFRGTILPNRRAPRRGYAIYFISIEQTISAKEAQMAHDPTKGAHASEASRKQSAARRRASSIATAATAVFIAVAFIAAAVMAWRLSSAEHNTGTSASATPDAVAVALAHTIAQPLPFTSLEDDVMEMYAAHDEEVKQAQAEEEAANREVPLATIEPTDLDAIPAKAELQTFSLFDDAAPELPEDADDAIRAAVKTAEELGKVGFVFFDASTGNGISYNAGAAVYGASSFKGPYAVYVCQALVDEGEITLNSPVEVASNNRGSIAINPASSWATSGAKTYPTGDLISAAVIESDNDAYGMLRNQYDSEGYDSWIAELGVTDAPRDPLSWYPTYCAQSSAKLWLNALNYLESDEPSTGWLAEQFRQTRTSFIRDGILGTEDGRDAEVMDKAGWISDSGPAYNAVCDAGIVRAGGRTYVMSIMTSQPDCTEARANVAALAATLFEAHEILE